MTVRLIYQLFVKLLSWLGIAGSLLSVFSTSWASQHFSDTLPGHGIATYKWTPA